MTQTHDTYPYHDPKPSTSGFWLGTLLLTAMVLAALVVMSSFRRPEVQGRQRALHEYRFDSAYTATKDSLRLAALHREADSLQREIDSLLRSR